MTEPGEQEQQTPKRKIYSRRQFLGFAGAAAAATTFGLTNPSKVFAEAEETQGVEKNKKIEPQEKEKDAWTEKKEAAIRGVFGYNPETDRWDKLIAREEFNEAGIVWPPRENLPVHDVDRLNAKLESHEASFRVKCDYRTLLNETVRRYGEILDDPYKTAIDPTVEEIDALIAKYSRITGFPEDVIKTIGWRENSLRSNMPSLHGDSYYPPSGDGVMSPNVHPPYWAEKVGGIPNTRGSEYPETDVVSFKGVNLPVYAGFIQYDCEANIAFGLAIYTHHLNELMISDDFALLRDEYLLKRSDDFGGKDATLMGVSYSVYHHGFSGIREKLKFSAISDRFVDPNDYSDEPVALAANTYAKYKPWDNPEYRMEGVGEASGCEFYSLISKDVQERGKKNSELFKLTIEAMSGEMGPLVSYFLDHPELRSEITHLYLRQFVDGNDEISKLNVVNLSEEEVGQIEKRLDKIFAFLEKNRGSSKSNRWYDDVMGDLIDVQQDLYKNSQLMQRKRDQDPGNEELAQEYDACLEEDLLAYSIWYVVWQSHSPGVWYFTEDKRYLERWNCDLLIGTPYFRNFSEENFDKIMKYWQNKVDLREMEEKSGTRLTQERSTIDPKNEVVIISED